MSSSCAMRVYSGGMEFRLHINTWRTYDVTSHPVLNSDQHNLCQVLSAIYSAPLSADLLSIKILSFYSTEYIQHFLLGSKTRDSYLKLSVTISSRRAIRTLLWIFFGSWSETHPDWSFFTKWGMDEVNVSSSSADYRITGLSVRKAERLGLEPTPKRLLSTDFEEVFRGQLHRTEIMVFGWYPCIESSAPLSADLLSVKILSVYSTECIQHFLLGSKTHDSYLKLSVKVSSRKAIRTQEVCTEGL